MKGNGSHVEEGFVDGAAVQGFNIAERVLKAISRHAYLVRGQPIEHKGIVGIRTVCNGDCARFICLRCANTSTAHGKPRPFLHHGLERPDCAQRKYEKEVDVWRNMSFSGFKNP